MHPINPFIVSLPMDSTFHYLLDTLYKVKLQVESLINLEYGFQLCALDSNGNSVGNFIPLGSGLTATQTGFVSRQYINHNNSSANPTWAFDWKSPANDPGPITFYACVVRGVADNMASTLDKVFSTNITIATLPIIADAGPDVEVCAGDSVQLSASGGTIYLWSPVAGLSNPNIADPVAFPTTTTNYSVTVSDGVNSDTDVVKVTVNPTPVPTITQAGDSLSTQNGFINYSWFFNDSPISNADGSSIFAGLQGFYQVAVVDVNGCVGTSDSIFVNVNHAPNIEFNELDLKIYPIPFNRSVTVEFSNHLSNARFEIIDAAGIVKLSGKISILQTELNNLHNILGSGLHILIVESSDGKSILKLFID